MAGAILVQSRSNLIAAAITRRRRFLALLVWLALGLLLGFDVLAGRLVDDLHG